MVASGYVDTLERLDDRTLLVDGRPMDVYLDQAVHVSDP